MTKPIKVPCGLVVLAAFLAGCAACVLFLMSLLDVFPHELGDAAREFRIATGLPVPDGLSVISMGETHGGLQGEGEFHLVGRVPKLSMLSLLERKPYWARSDWKKGPVPNEVVRLARFGIAPHERRGQISEAERESALNGAETYFIVRDVCCEDSPYSDGHLILLDFRTNRIWISNWNL